MAKFLEWLKANFFSALTVLAGAVLLLCLPLGILPSNLIAPTTLGVVVFLATSLLVDHSKKLSDIQEAVQVGYERTIASLGGVHVIPLVEGESGVGYLTKKLHEAKSRVDLTSLSPPIQRNHSAATTWEKTLDAVMETNNIRFRYIFNLDDSNRSARTERLLKNPKVRKFFAGAYESTGNSAPMPNFMIIDDAEVVVILPSPYSDPETWLSIKHPEVIKSYSRYFQCLWDKSIKVDSIDTLNNIRGQDS